MFNHGQKVLDVQPSVVHMNANFGLLPSPHRAPFEHLGRFTRSTRQSMRSAGVKYISRVAFLQNYFRRSSQSDF
jgi:hypothetical protein